MLRISPYYYVGTWANRPAASTITVGSDVWFTDVGVIVNGVCVGSGWYSDGTNYRPMGGFLPLAVWSGNVAAPIATLTGNGTTQNFVLPYNVKFPAGMLFDGSQVEISASFEKQGVHTGNFLIGISNTPTPVSPGSNDFLSISSNAANPSVVRTFIQAGIHAGAWHEPTSGVPFLQSGSTASMGLDHADANVNSEDRYVNVSIGTAYTTDLANLISLSVAFIA